MDKEKMRKNIGTLTIILLSIFLPVKVYAECGTTIECVNKISQEIEKQKEYNEFTSNPLMFSAENFASGERVFGFTHQIYSQVNWC